VATQTLYVTDFYNSAVLIYRQANQIDDTEIVPAEATLEGATTLLEGPQGVTLLP
jgi:hypothetical protein